MSGCVVYVWSICLDVCVSASPALFVFSPVYHSFASAVYALYVWLTPRYSSSAFPSVTQSVCVFEIFFSTNLIDSRTNRLWAQSQRVSDWVSEWANDGEWARQKGEHEIAWERAQGEHRESTGERDWWGLENIFAYLHVLCADVLCECAVHCENELIHSWRYALHLHCTALTAEVWH